MMSMIDYLILAWLNKFGKAHTYDIWMSLRGLLPTSRSTIYRRASALHKRRLLRIAGRERRQGRSPTVIYELSEEGHSVFLAPSLEAPTPLELMAAMWLTENKCKVLVEQRLGFLRSLVDRQKNNPYGCGVIGGLNTYYCAALEQEISMLQVGIFGGL